MIEKTAELDDELLHKYVAEEPISPDDIRAALRRATILNKCTPVVCGSAFKNKGVQPLLDAVIYFLPSPTDVPASAWNQSIYQNRRSPESLRR